MRQLAKVITVATRGRGLHDFTAPVADWVRGSGIREGLLTLFIRHTSASLLVQENWDAGVQRDLDRFFSRIVPDGDPLFEHVEEGPDDMSAHVRSALTQTHLAIPVLEGKPALGTWQGLYVYEHRRAGHSRQVALHLLGE